MKKLILSLLLLTSAIAVEAQIILAGTSPASVETNFEFSWADPQGGDWNCPDFTIPGTYIEGELMIVDDGSPGVNPQGNPLSAEGCNPLINDLTGKIAVVYRNTCEFGTKSLNAQNAGAIGVIIINRVEEVIQMGGGQDGLNVDIPVGFIKASDGQTLVDAMANGPVEVFFGNRAGIYANDLSTTMEESLLPKAKVTPSRLAENGTEFNFKVGLTIRNYGFDAQNDVMVNATVEDPNGNTIYDETVGPFSLNGIVGNQIDSVNIFPDSTTSFPDFAPATVEEGYYTLEYSVVNTTTTDDFPDDNVMSIDFLVAPNLFSYVRVNEDTMPLGSDYYQPGDAFSIFGACIAFVDSNSARMAVEGLSFSASKADDNDITGEVLNIKAYRWLDQFENIADPNLGFNALTEAGSATYIFPGDSQRVPVRQDFDQPIFLNDGERYLFCVESFSSEIFIGFDRRTMYDLNQNVGYLQPIDVISNDNEYFAAGFTGAFAPAIGVHMTDTAEIEVPDTIFTTIGGKDVIIVGGDTFELWGDLYVPFGVDDHEVESMSIYPNPTNGMLTIEAPQGFKSSLDVQITDMAGRTILRQSDAIKRGENRLLLDLSPLNSGSYFVTLSSQGERVKVEQILIQ